LPPSPFGLGSYNEQPPSPFGGRGAHCMEDTGYETARLRGADALATAATMLRQRGLTVFEICERALAAPLRPLPARAPTEAEHAASEAAVLAAAAAAAAAGIAPHGAQPAAATSAACPALAPVICARFEAEAAPPEGTAAATHRLRGLATPGDETWVFSLQQPKIGIKTVRAVRDAAEARLSALEPSRRPARLGVVVLSRDKIKDRTVATLLEDGTIHRLERFLFSELTYNVTRHFLVPPHRLCAPDEVAALRRTFPKLALQSRDDAITRFHGLLSGDVVLYNRTRAGVLGGPYWREVQ
jgi:hypothetical protein